MRHTAAPLLMPIPVLTEVGYLLECEKGAVAERLKADAIATLDHRHFSVVRPRHLPAFKLLPGASD
jgi:hypothetical protein